MMIMIGFKIDEVIMTMLLTMMSMIMMMIYYSVNDVTAVIMWTKLKRTNPCQMTNSPMPNGRLTRFISARFNVCTCLFLGF